MCTWDLQESWCHSLLVVKCKMMGFLFPDLRCASKHVYAPRSQAVGIVKDLGTVLVFRMFSSSWKESPRWIEKSCSRPCLELKRIQWDLRAAIGLQELICSAISVNFGPCAGGTISPWCFGHLSVRTQISFIQKQLWSLAAALSKGAAVVAISHCPPAYLNLAP